MDELKKSILVTTIRERHHRLTNLLLVGFKRTDPAEELVVNPPVFDEEGPLGVASGGSTVGHHNNSLLSLVDEVKEGENLITGIGIQRPGWLVG